MTKNRQRAGNSNWMPKEAPWRVTILAIMAKLAIFAKMAELAKIANLEHSPLGEWRF